MAAVCGASLTVCVCFLLLPPAVTGQSPIITSVQFTKNTKLPVQSVLCPPQTSTKCPLSPSDQYKAAVAHRDVTSRNVLVRADLSCVLADFGLSMRLTGTLPCRPGDEDTVAISEVGTVRYMAPEVLGGALNLRDCESALKQVDVYALGLLYWESFRRCSHLFPGEAVPEYQLAFQAELGNHPSFEEMQVLVVREKVRPRFPEAWKDNSLVSVPVPHLSSDLSPNLSLNLSPICTGSKTFVMFFLLCLFLSLFSSVRQARSSTSDNLLSSSTLTPASTLCTILESHHTGGAVPSVFRPLTEEDLETQKLDPKEVDKNLRESSDDNLMERSQKQFSSAALHCTDLPYRQILQTDEGNSPVSVLQGELGGVGGVETIHPLPKQQNLPQRPTSLPLLRKTKETVSSRLKLGKSNHREVETGVAKMNMMVLAMAAEPHQVTAVTINTSTRGGGGAAVSRVHSKNAVASSYSAGAPTLMTNVLIGGGQTNPAGPQLEDEDKMVAGEDQGMNLLNASPDENEPLLSREQPPAESQPGSNANNNNNRTAWASNKVHGSDPDPCVRRELCAGPTPIPGSSRSPETCLIQTQTEEAPVIVPNALGSPVSDPNPPVSESQHPKPTVLPEPAVALRRPAFDPQSPGLLPPQNRRRRPCSLDLSASCISSESVDSRRASPPFIRKPRRCRPSESVQLSVRSLK
ncbi:bone morphogenetic protein receptor type-2-like [Etheostoma cragini]|uniref:bone morphogenetic protein receptor type-2-like n=1 Tax=Etheostoma cragini TaxID=417921 RepID=UPI00155F2A25|nr:bone morphogenetic protein receptor type-2-like [Etheostoma cragini]